MIHLDLSETQTDYLYRLLMARPMGEVESLVNTIRQQVRGPEPAQTPAAGMPLEAPQKVLGAPNGSATPDDSPGLP